MKKGDLRQKLSRCVCMDAFYIYRDNRRFARRGLVVKYATAQTDEEEVAFAKTIFQAT